jgi:hypothetical protein
LAVVALPANLPAQATNPFIGTWQLNRARSQYRRGTAPQSETLSIQSAGKGIRVTASGEDAQGNPISTSYTAAYDGKDYPVSGAPGYDAVSLRRVNTYSVSGTRKRVHKVVQTFTLTVTRDRKTVTLTTDGTDAAGQRFHSVAVFVKPGRPV